MARETREYPAEEESGEERAVTVPEGSETVLSFRGGRSVSELLAEVTPVSLGGATSGCAPATRSKYVPRELLGRGGMGSVWLAADRDIGREVAVKTLLAVHDRRAVERFVVEGQVTGQLEHPNIVPVYDLGAGETDGQPFLVMKRVRGRSLAEVLDEIRERGGPRPSSRRRRAVHAGRKSGSHRIPPETRSTGLPERELSRLLDIFLKVCDAVAYAHSRGVIHRDLKPENVMVGSFGEVLVMDWGLAKVAGRAETPADRERVVVRETAETQSGAIAGTPMYMSPEQALGEIEEIDERSDIYSLGALLYEVLTLAPPFEAEGLAKLLDRVRLGAVVPPSRRCRAPWAVVPRELEAVVMKAMAKDPQDRYQRVEDLRAEIDAYLAGRTVGAAEYSPFALLLKWARRHRTAVLGAVATTVAILAGMIAVAVGIGRAEVRAREEEEARQREQRKTSSEAAYREADRAWNEAENVEFNKAAPQEYMRAHVASLSALGQAFARHPEPPQAWRSELTLRTSAVTNRALEVSDWAMAQFLADSLLAWGAISDAEKASRLAAVDDAKRKTEKADEDRLLEILARIRDAQPKDGKQGSRLFDGELPERALRLARSTGPDLTRVVLARLARPGESQVLERVFLIELLGRKGDVRTEHEGVRAPEWIRREIEQAVKEGHPGKTDEVAALLWAAARLEARAPESFPDLAALVGRVSRTYKGIGPVEVAAAGARRLVDLIRERTPLTRPESPSKEEIHRREVSELANWAVASISSRNAYARFLVERARGEESHTDRELAFLYDELGLAGVTEPPEPSRPESAPPAVLRAAFERAYEGTGKPIHGPDISAGALERAIAAATALSRLEDPSFAPRLLECRYERVEFSSFSKRTELAFALLPLAATEPRTAAEFTDRGLARRDHGDLSGAIEDHSRAIALDPNDAAAYSNRGAARRDQGDLAGAIEDFSRAIALDPNDAVAYSNRGAARCDQRDLARAIEDLLRAVTLDAENARAYLNLGCARRAQGNLVGAIEDFSRAIALDPNFASAYKNRGVARCDQGDLARAIEDFSRAIALDPNDAGAYSNRGNARGTQGDLAGALEDHSRAVALDPDNPIYYANRGSVRHDQGDFGGAIEDYSRALSLDPNDARGYSARGAARHEQGDLAGAIEDYERALQLDERVWQAWGNRGIALAALGRREEARESFARALERCPPAQQAAVENNRREALGE